ncbi:MAG: NusG domain II-containing protein [Gammaproteobacteria bacterium]|nr:NusG domain II-containing protein [Gammaproteobacteria bacterium]
MTASEAANKKNTRNSPLLKPADIIILLFACLLSASLYYIFWFGDNRSGVAETLQVQVADNTPREYALNKDRILDIEGAIGHSLIEIKQGKARFIRSPCRNKFCVFHGWLTTAGDSSACLPNRISISLRGKTKEYDAIAL